MPPIDSGLRSIDNIKIDESLHDRFLILDNTTCCHIGASLKDSGKKSFALGLLEYLQMVQDIFELWGIITKDKKADVAVIDMPLLDTRFHLSRIMSVRTFGNARKKVLRQQRHVMSDLSGYLSRYQKIFMNVIKIGRWVNLQKLYLFSTVKDGIICNTLRDILDTLRYVSAQEHRLFLIQYKCPLHLCRTALNAQNF